MPKTPCSKIIARYSLWSVVDSEGISTSSLWQTFRRFSPHPHQSSARNYSSWWWENSQPPQLPWRRMLRRWQRSQWLTWWSSARTLTRSVWLRSRYGLPGTRPYNSDQEIVALVIGLAWLYTHHLMSALSHPSPHTHFPHAFKLLTCIWFYRRQATHSSWICSAPNTSWSSLQCSDCSTTRANQDQHDLQNLNVLHVQNSLNWMEVEWHTNTQSDQPCVWIRLELCFLHLMHNLQATTTIQHICLQPAQFRIQQIKSLKCGGCGVEFHCGLLNMKASKSQTSFEHNRPVL